MANENYDTWFKKNFIDEAKAAIDSRSSNSTTATKETNSGGGQTLIIK